MGFFCFFCLFEVSDLYDRELQQKTPRMPRGGAVRHVGFANFSAPVRTSITLERNTITRRPFFCVRRVLGFLKDAKMRNTIPWERDVIT